MSTTIALYKSHTDNTPIVREVSWDRLVELLLDFRSGEKEGPAWSPVTIDGSRKAENVTSVNVAVFDIDHVTMADIGALAQRIRDLSFVAHSSYSHNPPQDCALRLAIQLSRPVSPEEWTGLWPRLVSEYRIPADPACKDVARLFFLPTVGEGEPLSFMGDGAPVDVDSWLDRPAPPSRERMSPKTTQPKHQKGSSPRSVLSVEDMRSLVARARSIKGKSASLHAQGQAEVLARILAQAPLASDGERDNTVNQAASLLAFALPDDIDPACAFELVRIPIASMPVDPEGVDHWFEKFRYSFDRAQERRAELSAARAAQDADLKSRIDELFPDKAAVTEPTSVPEDQWETLLMVTVGRDGEARPESSGENASVILRYSPETRGTVRYNEVEGTVEVTGGPLAKIPRDSLDTGVTNWLRRWYGQRLAINVVAAQIGLVARMNPYDPVKEYLAGLQWDGESRLDRWLIDYAGAETTNENGEDITRYLELVGAKWAISAVARGLDPGCKVDTMLVLQGPQGVGKTTAVRALAGHWYCSTQIELGSKDSQMLTRRSWIMELPELASMRRSAVETLKAFLSLQEDQFRPPYGRETISVPRRCVMIGTTNESEFLQDETGNRRFWPVKVTSVDLDGLEADRDQIWAEAVHRYRSGEVWWLDADGSELASREADLRLMDSGQSMFISRIRKWWYSTEPLSRPDFVRSDEVAELALNIPPDRLRRGHQIEIGRAMLELGFEHARRRVEGAKVRGYSPTGMLLTLTSKEANRPLGKEIYVCTEESTAQTKDAEAVEPTESSQKLGKN